VDNTDKLLIVGGAVVVGLIFLTGGAAAAPFVSLRAVRDRVMKQAEWIWRAGKDQRVEPALLAAMIDVESSGVVDARGEAGEIGLMQIIPATGKWICDYSSAQLADPALNIRCGAIYMRYCLDRFNGNIAASIAAYNSGPDNVWVDMSRGGKIVAYSAAKRHAMKVMGRVTDYRVLFRQRYPTYYGLMFRPDQWFLNMGDFDGLSG